MTVEEAAIKMLAQDFFLMNICFSVPLGQDLGEEEPGRQVGVSAVRNPVSRSGGTTSRQRSASLLVAPRSPSAFSGVRFLFILIIPAGVKWSLLVVPTCLSQTASDGECLSTCLSVILVSFLTKCLRKSLAHFIEQPIYERF